MQEFSYTIKDPDGIHARPAGLLVQKLKEFESKVTFSKGEQNCDGKQLIKLMKMRVKKGETLVIRIEGGDEAEAAAAAKDFLEANL